MTFILEMLTKLMPIIKQNYLSCNLLTQKVFKNFQVFVLLKKVSSQFLLNQYIQDIGLKKVC